ARPPRPRSSAGAPRPWGRPSTPPPARTGPWFPPLAAGGCRPGPAGGPPRGWRPACPPAATSIPAARTTTPPARGGEAVASRRAHGLLDRHLAEEGCYASTVGLVVWGTAAMRTGGDDVAEALALLGVRPVWQAESGRVSGLELIPLEELGRPRVDVVLRISGF